VYAIERRAGEPWYSDARAALEAMHAGDASFETRLAVAPFVYGRWNSAAQRHAASESSQRPTNASEIYDAEGAPLQALRRR